MFWNILFWIYAVSAAISAVMFGLLMIKSLHTWREQHPNVVTKKSHWTDVVHLAIQIILVILCPLVNSVMAWYMVAYFDDVHNDVIRKMEYRYRDQISGRKSVGK